MGFVSQTRRGPGELKREEPINHEQPDVAGLTELLSLYLQLVFSSSNCGRGKDNIYLDSVSRLQMYQHYLQSTQQLMQKLKFHNGRRGEKAAV